MLLANRTALGYALAAGIAVSGCGTAAPDTSENEGTFESGQVTLPSSEEVPAMGPLGGAATYPSLAPVVRVMHTFIPQSLEIDDYILTPRRHGDANLFTGPDPVDGTPSVLAPKGASPSFIDWNDLGGSAVAEHRYVDASVRLVGLLVDKDAFAPKGAACLGVRSVEPAFDLTYIAVANNLYFAYLAAQRADNEMDAGMAFLFTRVEPETIAWTPCGAAAKSIRFGLTAGSGIGNGDVLLVGHFADDGHTELFRSYITQRPGRHLSPSNALDTNQHWAELSAVSAVASNRTRTAPGSFGVVGVVSTAGSPAVLEPSMFVELAVPMSLFLPNEKGRQTYYLTAFSWNRALDRGGTLKDIAGPVMVEMSPPRIALPIPPLVEQWLPPESPRLLPFDLQR